MGSFYCNIHLRTQDRQFVEHAWQSYWEGREHAAWVMISPVYGQWVSVFDWRCDQQDTDLLTDLASYLSRAADSVALAFQVQDSALAEYWLFNHGNEVDHYTSNEEYFAATFERPEVTPDSGSYSGFGPDEKESYAGEEDVSDGGNTGLLKTLCNVQTSELELEAILRTPAAIADEILTALASALGINDIWASVGYHYLATEGDTIPGIDKFIRLPANEPVNMQGKSEKE